MIEERAREIACENIPEKLVREGVEEADHDQRLSSL
jgi:hypothetical protein